MTGDFFARAGQKPEKDYCKNGKDKDENEVNFLSPVIESELRKTFHFFASVRAIILKKLLVLQVFPLFIWFSFFLSPLFMTLFPYRSRDIHREEGVYETLKTAQQRWRKKNRFFLHPSGVCEEKRLFLSSAIPKHVGVWAAKRSHLFRVKVGWKRPLFSSSPSFLLCTCQTRGHRKQFTAWKKHRCTDRIPPLNHFVERVNERRPMLIASGSTRINHEPERESSLVFLCIDKGYWELFLFVLSEGNGRLNRKEMKGKHLKWSHSCHDEDSS